MSTWPEEGGAWGCQINAHRHRWNGTICNDPCNWECGADRKFRSEYCDQGDDRCYHAYAFARESGQIGVDENGIGWLMDSDRKALDGQVVFFYAYQTQEPQGMISNQRTVIAGIYIVDRVEKRDLGHKSQYWMYPKRGFAIELGDLQLQTERFQRLDRPYMRHFGQTEVNRMLQKILDALTRRNKNDIRIKQIAEIPSFIKSAAHTNAERRKKDEYDETSDYKQTPFATLKNFPISSKNPTPAEVNTKAKKEPETAVPHIEIPEPKAIQRSVSAFDFGLLSRNAAAYGLDTDFCVVVFALKDTLEDFGFFIREEARVIQGFHRPILTCMEPAVGTNDQMSPETLDLHQEDASFRKDQCIYLKDAPIKRHEFEVGPDLEGIPIRKLLAKKPQSHSLPLEFGGRDLMPPLFTHSHTLPQI